MQRNPSHLESYLERFSWQRKMSFPKPSYMNTSITNMYLWIKSYQPLMLSWAALAPHLLIDVCLILEFFYFYLRLAVKRPKFTLDLVLMARARISPVPPKSFRHRFYSEFLNRRSRCLLIGIVLSEAMTFTKIRSNVLLKLFDRRVQLSFQRNC